jgi:hypothetical protein
MLAQSFLALRHKLRDFLIGRPLRKEVRAHQSEQCHDNSDGGCRTIHGESTSWVSPYKEQLDRQTCI